MIVVDASALVDWLLQTPERGPTIGARMGAARLVYTLDAAFIEVLSALRRRVSRGELDAARAFAGIELLELAPLERVESAPLARRVWSLRGSLTPYDAAYVALAEALEAPLLTSDRRLARSHGHRAVVVEA